MPVRLDKGCKRLRDSSSHPTWHKIQSRSNNRQRVIKNSEQAVKNTESGRARAWKRQGLALSQKSPRLKTAILPHLPTPILKMTLLTASLSEWDTAERLSPASDNVSESPIVLSTTLSSAKTRRFATRLCGQVSRNRATYRHVDLNEVIFSWMALWFYRCKLFGQYQLSTFLMATKVDQYYQKCF